MERLLVSGGLILAGIAAFFLMEDEAENGYVLEKSGSDFCGGSDRGRGRESNSAGGNDRKSELKKSVDSPVLETLTKTPPETPEES